MRARIFLTVLLTALFIVLSGCGTTPNCPVCGTTLNGSYAVINVIPVPEHNPTGEPGGPFNSFDISWIATPPPGGLSGTDNLDYISDRIGLAVVVIDTTQDLAVNAIQGSNAVTDNGNDASPCSTIVQPGTTNTMVSIIPPIISVFGNFTRYGCRTDMSWQGGPTFHLISGFGANGNFGGFPGAQCCAARANGVNPMSGPDGLQVSPDGSTLTVGNGSSSVVIFDLTTMNLSTNPPTPPTVIADIPTGVSADYDGPLGIAPCVSSWNGEAGSAADCGDDRGDEQALGQVMGADGNMHQVLAIIDGDPGLPFITFLDLTNVMGKSGTNQQQHCLPIDETYAYGPYPAGFSPSTYPYQGTAETWVVPATGAAFNPPSCVIGQIYYDGAGGTASLTSTGAEIGLNNPPVPVDNVGATFPCPDPSNPSTFGGVSGSAAASMIPGIGTTPLTGTQYVIPCHHGPIVSYVTGQYCVGSNPSANAAGTQIPPFSDPTCAGAVAPAGLGAMAWNPANGHVLLANSNSILTTNIGNVDEIDPQVANNTCGPAANQPCGPVVINSYVTPNCMPTSIVQGPGENFLIGCADHDGEAFPPNEYVINFTPGNTINCVTPPLTNCIQIYNTGGVDEIWYNPGDNKYYLAARDLPTGAAMGVIDAGTNQWLVNFPTGSNAHSISVDPITNHAFVPLQAGTICTTQSANGCVGVVAEQ
jgi:hypothetical protein